MKNFFNIYFNLIKKNLSFKKLATVFCFELFGSLLSIFAIFLLGFVVQILTLDDFSTHKVFDYLPTNTSVWLIVFSAIFFNIILLCISAASYFYSVTLCRKYTRQSYLSSLDHNIQRFALSDVDDLALDVKEREGLNSFFTTDVHLTFISLEAILRAIRPISLIVVFLVPMTFLEPNILYFLLVVLLFTFPFLLKINRNTASSAKSVFGIERKQVYAEIVSVIKDIDMNLIPNSHVNEKKYDQIKMDRMLDNFDYWKLSSDKVAYAMTIVKSIGLQVAIVVLVGALYVYEQTSVSTLAILGMGLLKVQEAFLSLFSRLTVLSRLYPIVSRYRNLEKKFNVAALEPTVEKGRYRKNALLTSSKMILISSLVNFRKSEISTLNEQLFKYDSNFDIRSLALGEYGEVFEAKLVKEIDLEKLIHEYISKEDVDNVIFDRFQKQAGFAITDAGSIVGIDHDVTKVLQAIDFKSKLFIYLLAFQKNEKIQYVRCTINQIEYVKSVLNTAFDSYLKPIVVFCNHVEESKKSEFDIFLHSSVGATLETDDIDLLI